MSIESTNAGFLGNLYHGLTGDANELLCSFMGPNFLKILLNKNNCPSGIFLPTIFKSCFDFCKYYNRAPSFAKACLTDAVVDFEGRLNGIIGGSEILGNCCNYFAQRLNHLPNKATLK